MGSCYIIQGAQLCDDLEGVGWEGGSGGRDMYIYMYIYIYTHTLMANAYYMAETNTTLQSNYPPIKNKKYKCKKKKKKGKKTIA